MVISIFKFLSRYYGISLNAGVKCSHTDLKRNFRFIKTCTFKYAEIHIDMVKSGKVIYVKDSYGEVSPYICPDIVNCTTKECEFVTYEDHINDDFIVSDILNIPTYQILDLMGKYKNRYSFYRLLKKELLRRGFYETKVYKLEKEILQNELDIEEEFYDKHKRKRKIKRKKS